MNETTPTVPLEQLCDPERGITYGIVKVGDFVSGGVPVIRGGDIRNNQIVFDDQKRVTEEVSNRFRRTILKGGEVLINLIAEPGHVAIVPNDLAGSNVSRDVAVIPLNDSVNHRFVCYFLKSPQCVQWLTSRLQGSVTQKINLNTLREVPVPVPPLLEQKAIARILSSLDDKIELNQQMNGTLEAIARAIFKSWFVDFDPVRAKMDGRQPEGIDAATADLFPNEFEDSPLGKIPKGWKVGRLDDLLVLQRGFDLPTSQRVPGKYPVIAASGSSGTHAEYKVKGPGVVTGRSGLLGKVFFVHEDFWPLNTSLWVKEFRISRPLHAYHLLRGLEFETFNSGSAVPTLNRNHVHSLPIVVPPTSVVEAFESLVMPMFRKCRENDKQSYTLADIHDALLSKLLSGEISLKETEKLMEAVA